MPRAVGILLLIAVACLPASAQTWLEFRPQGIGYSVEMPGGWTLSTQDIRSAIGLLKSHVASVNTNTRAYITSYMSYPAEAMNGRPVTAILDGHRDGSVANVKGTLRSEQRLMISDLPAREIIIDAPNKLVVIARFFMVQNTLVQALVAGPQNVENDPDARRFIGSLKVASP